MKNKIELLEYLSNMSLIISLSCSQSSSKPKFPFIEGPRVINNQLMLIGVIAKEGNICYGHRNR